MVEPTFHAFDFQHITVLTLIAAGCVVLAFKARSGAIRKWTGRLLGFLLLAYAAVLYAQQALHRSLQWEYSLPLELCNLVLIASIGSLFRPNQLLTEIAYFWGFGGVLQATVTPELSSGFPSWDFILFFWSHGATLMAIVFLISSRGFKPRRGSFLRMMAAINMYGLLVGILDWIMGWNYGFLCRKPLEPSLLDLLGPWPWYLLSLEGIAAVTFLLLDLPWKFGDALRKRKPATADNT